MNQLQNESYIELWRYVPTSTGICRAPCSVKLDNVFGLSTTLEIGGVQSGMKLASICRRQQFQRPENEISDAKHT